MLPYIYNKPKIILTNVKPTYSFYCFPFFVLYFVNWNTIGKIFTVSYLLIYI